MRDERATREKSLVHGEGSSPPEAVAATSDAHLFGTAAIHRLFFRAAIPGALSMIASSLYATIDAAIIGRFLGSTAFAAVNLASPYTYIMFAVSDLIGVGSSVPIAIALGRRDERSANNAFSVGCVMIELVSIVLGAVMCVIAPALMSLSGATGELAELATTYLRVYAASLPVTAIFYAVDNYMRICGQTHKSLALNILMATLGGVFEYVALGVFGLGIREAALGFTCSLLICSLVAFGPFFRGKMQLRFCRPRFSAKLTRQIVTSGTPVFLNNISGRAMSIVMNFFLLAIGGELAVSVYGIIMNVDEFFWSLLYGMSDALQPAMSYNWGARLRGRVQSLKRWSFASSAVCSALFFAAVFAVPEFFIQIFMDESNAALMAMAVPAMRIACIGYLANWIAFTAQTYLMSIEHSKEASVLSVCSSFGFPLALIVLLEPLGLTGLWLNVPIAAILSGVLAIVLTRRCDAAEGVGRAGVRGAGSGALGAGRRARGAGVGARAGALVLKAKPARKTVVERDDRADEEEYERECA